MVHDHHKAGICSLCGQAYVHKLCHWADEKFICGGGGGVT